MKARLFVPCLPLLEVLNLWKMAGATGFEPATYGFGEFPKQKSATKHN
jgi:hypothetical protein